MKKAFALLFLFLFNTASFSKGVVSLLPSITEIIVEYGKGKSLVAVSDYSVLPEGFNVERIGSLYNLNVEELIKLNPDIVFAEVSYKRTLSRISILNEKVVYLSFLNLDDVYKSYRVIGEKLGVEKDRVEKKIEQLKASINRLKTLNKCRGKRGLIILNSQSDRFYACGNNYFSEVFEKIGFKNALKTNIPYPDISYESFYKLNPDIIIILSAKKPLQPLCKRKPFKMLENCRKKTVYYIYGDKVLHAGSGLNDMLSQVEDKLNLCFK